MNGLIPEDVGWIFTKGIGQAFVQFWYIWLIAFGIGLSRWLFERWVRNKKRELKKRH